MEQSVANPRQYSLSLEVRQSDTSHDKLFGNNFDIQLLDPATEEHPVPCNCGMAKCALIKALLDKEMEGMEDLEELPPQLV